MTLTTSFPGTSLPDGWSFHAPQAGDTASFQVTGGRLHITAPTGFNRDSVFGASSADFSAGVVHALPDHDGAIDIAVQVDTDLTDLGAAGFTLLAYQDNANVFRASWYKPATLTNWAVNVFGFSRAAGSNANIVNNSDQTFMSGHPSWLRITYNPATGLWTLLHSSDGFTWLTRASGTRTFSSSWFKVSVQSATGTPTFTARINQVIDVIARGNTDLRDTPVAERDRVSVTQINGTDGALPTGWIDESYGGSGLTWTGTRLRMTDVGNTEVRGATSSRFRWTGARYLECGLLVKAINPTTSSSCYFTPQLTFAVAEDTWNDQYSIVGGYGQEVQSGSIRRPIRLDDPRDGNVSMSPEASSTGLDETPYMWLKNLTDSSWNATARWWRFERIATANGHLRWRAKEWLDGDPEPSTWNLYDGQEETNDVPLGPAFSLSRNALTTSVCAVDIEHLDFYRLVAQTGPVVPPSGRSAVAGALNTIAGTRGLTETAAANAAAGTTGLTLAGALNALAGTERLTETGAANALAGTTGLTLQAALNAYAEAL
jgi:hypothetical protein